MFRQKLDNVEVITSPSVDAIIMRRLGRKEFLRLNPARFNIWYLGGILITGAALAIILNSGSDKNKQVQPQEPPAQTAGEMTVENRNIAQEKTGVSTINEPVKSIINPDAGTKENKSEALNDLTDEKTEVRRDNIKVSPPGPVSRDGLFSESISGKDRLQGGSKASGGLIEPSVTEGCAPLRVKFRIKPGSFDACRWSFGDGGYSAETDPEWIFDEEGEYKVTLKIFNANKLLSESSATITIHPKPKAHFEITPEAAVIPNDEIRFLNYSSGAVKSMWNFGDGNSSDLNEPTHSYARFGRYNVQLIVFSEYGCSDSLTVKNAFSGSAYFINFPNAFIPNPTGPSGGNYIPKGDEADQVFHPVYSGVSEYQLKIFSKLGILIFESNDVNIGWDGYFKGQIAKPGVYIWKVRGNFLNGEPFTKMGDVTLLKN